MKRFTSASPRRRGWVFIPTIITLAIWRLRQTWLLLFVTGLGMLAAVVIVCAVPLYTQVSMTAGLRGTLNASPQDSELALQVLAQRLSPKIAPQEQQVFDDFMRQHLGSYLGGLPDPFIELPPQRIVAPSVLSSAELGLIGASMPQAARHLKLLEGRLPAPRSDQFEIAITQETAQSLELPLGSTLAIHLPLIGLATSSENLLSLQIVGIFAPAPDDFYWHLQSFEPNYLGEGTYASLMSNDAFLATLGHIAAQDQVDHVTFGNGAQPTLSWFYHLNVSQIGIAQLDDLMSRLDSAQAQISENMTVSLTGIGYISSLQFFGPVLPTDEVPSILQRFRDRAALVHLPIDILLLQILGLVLFFISMTASVLVDRQAEVISLLRSRGASRRQVFGAFVVQALAPGLIALLAGPLLAIPTARLLSHYTLAPADQQALNSIAGNPLPVALGVGWFALAAALSATLALLLAVRSAANRDVLEMRRESARAAHPPLWQRLHLDLIAASVALSGALLSLYVANSGVADAQTNLLIAAPLALVAPIFLVIAGVLFFLRLFPLLLRLIAWLAGQRPEAAPLLALAQMARAPRQALRLILLLALASSFSIFTLVFTASESQQIYSVAAYQTGADFSGPLPSMIPPYPPLAQQTASYRHLPGVMSATLGYTADASVNYLDTPALPLALRAVDAQTFAQTAIWTDQDSTQPLGALMALLQRPVQSEIPAIVDARAWSALGLTGGTSFMLTLDGHQFVFVAVAKVQHIPTVNDSLVSGGTSNYTPPGGLLVDYHTLELAYDGATSSLGLPPLHPNYLWLRTSDNPALLARTRAALSSGPLTIQALKDRRAMIVELERDPLYLALTGVLALGAIATLLLALTGSLLASWLSVRTRLTSFAVLRALGSPPRQIASVLTWEQALVYTAAIALGTFFGALLAATTVPALVFTSAPDPGQVLSSGAFYAIQHVLPTQVVIPASLLVAFAVLVAICALALGMMARIASKPAISQTLRLNED